MSYRDRDYCASDAHVASTGTFLPEAWSYREGSIILSAGKETFETLGLPGTKISAQMPGAPEQYRMSDYASLRFYYFLPQPTPLAVISVSLNTPSVNVRSDEFILDSITRWDRTREESGQGQWDFAFRMSHPGA